MEANFNCSTPYACPEEQISLQWLGQDPARSITSNHQKLEPTGISHLGTLHMPLSWQDHGRTLQCQLSVAEHKTQGKIHLQVQCECAGRHSLGTEGTSVASPAETVPSSSLGKQSPHPRGKARHAWTSRVRQGERHR